MRSLGRSTNKISAICALATGLAIMGLGLPAQAQISYYSFEVDGASTNRGISSSNPAGQISVNQLDATDIQITMTLNNGFGINNGNSNHPALAFNLTTLGTVSFSGLTAGFTLGGPISNAPPFGGLGYSIVCGTACGPTGAPGYTGTLTFKVSSTSALSLGPANPFNGQQIYFASDLVDTAGNTGNVGAVASPH